MRSHTRLAAVALLILIVASGTVLFFTRSVEVFRNIRTRFIVEKSEDIAQIILVTRNGTLVKPVTVTQREASFDYPYLFYFHASAPFYAFCIVSSCEGQVYVNSSNSVYLPWRTVGSVANWIGFQITVRNSTFLYVLQIPEGVEYWDTGANYWFYVHPAISVYNPCHPYLPWDVTVNWTAQC